MHSTSNLPAAKSVQAKMSGKHTRRSLPFSEISYSQATYQPMPGLDRANKHTHYTPTRISALIMFPPETR